MADQCLIGSSSYFANTNPKPGYGSFGNRLSTHQVNYCWGRPSRYPQTGPNYGWGPLRAWAHSTLYGASAHQGISMEDLKDPKGFYTGKLKSNRQIGTKSQTISIKDNITSSAIKRSQLM